MRRRSPITASQRKGSSSEWRVSHGWLVGRRTCQEAACGVYSSSTLDFLPPVRSGDDSRTQRATVNSKENRIRINEQTWAKQTSRHLAARDSAPPHLTPHRPPNPSQTYLRPAPNNSIKRRQLAPTRLFLDACLHSTSANKASTCASKASLSSSPSSKLGKPTAPQTSRAELPFCDSHIHIQAYIHARMPTHTFTCPTKINAKSYKYKLKLINTIKQRHTYTQVYRYHSCKIFE